MKKLPSYHVRKARRTLVIAAFIAVSFVFMIGKTQKAKKNAKAVNVLERILERDTLIALTNYNSISYFSYRGRPMGFQYDMLTLFANYLGVELRI
ncbi:MAG: hypothetical protein C0599_17125, partial [Salinivirgaceae bacterium]